MIVEGYSESLLLSDMLFVKEGLETLLQDTIYEIRSSLNQPISIIRATILAHLGHSITLTRITLSRRTFLSLELQSSRTSTRITLTIETSFSWVQEWSTHVNLLQSIMLQEL